ncbi:PspA/IM30 family protein [Oscillatoria sp. FACHB-1406]|uniref:PspA/IM30 family protein n=1 Tax=Oscillatoria sp. FACHB-1406 TaxID=2692846 RepID=UPI001683F57F|nr:PspA/IM30 family protein [Oscillatoria sp. FACHB-1406]MBD2578502.1 PspA/IM30 family protein [Oscillatoria sp. FACHB-1406]
MGELFDRMSRVARAELNADGEYGDRNYPSEGAALVAGGVISGASVGKIGILAGGTGYSLGTIPLAAVGALSGAALFEVLRSLVENDASSAKAAAIGATGGAATSAVVGGVGVSVGGSAFGVGMASMAAGGAVVGLGLVGLNRLLQQGLDPEYLLERAIDEMEMDAWKVRQAITNVVVSQKNLKPHYEQAEEEVTRWEGRVKLALQKGDKFLAGEALKRKKMHAEILSSLKEPRDRGLALVNSAKEKLALLEDKIVEAKTMRTSLKAKITTLKLGQASPNAFQESSAAMKAFERMEEKIKQLESRSQGLDKLSKADWDAEFTRIELDINTSVDEELEKLKRMLSSGQIEPPVDEELEELKEMISPQQSKTSTNGALEESRQTFDSTKSAFSVEEELERLKGMISSHQFQDSADKELEKLRQTLSSINNAPSVEEELE